MRGGHIIKTSVLHSTPLLGRAIKVGGERERVFYILKALSMELDAYCFVFPYKGLVP